MKLTDLKFQPGVDKQDSPYAAGDDRRYVDSQLVRFHYGKPERWKGWSYLPNPNQTVIGVVRDTHSWVSLDGNRYLALGTDRKLYILEGSALYDITPIRATESLTNPFTTVSGSPIVTVTDAAHGASAGDFVTFTDGSANNVLDGIEFNNEFEITTIVDANNYTITYSSNATGATAGGGGSVTASYQITVGPATSTYGYGWGVLTWGLSTWGTARSSSSITLDARNWSLDNFGEDLIATALNGGTYQWDTSSGTGTRAVSLGATAPVASRFSLVSSDTRHLFLFGTCTTVTDAATQDDLFFRFSDRESLTQWAPKATNEAGSLRIADGSRIIGAVTSTGQILVWTDQSLHGIQFVGTPFTFGQRQLGANCGLIAQHAAVDVNGKAFWMGDDAFYVYDGVVKKMPCSVQDYVYDDLSYTNKNDIACGTNPEFNEIMWYYPSSSATQIDRVVVYNYLENTWYTSTLGRTSYLGNYTFENPIATQYNASLVANATTSTGVTDTPYGVTAGASYVYNQEVGNNQADGTAVVASLTTGSVEIADGDQFMSVSRFVPDFTDLANEVAVTLTLEDYPQATTSQITSGNVSSTTTKIDVRGRGRSVKLNFATSTVDDTNWRLGSMKLQLRPDGRR
jgi:rubredoxin